MEKIGEDAVYDAYKTFLEPSQTLTLLSIVGETSLSVPDDRICIPYRSKAQVILQGQPRNDMALLARIVVGYTRISNISFGGGYAGHLRCLI